MANPDFQDESTFDQQGAGPTTVFMPTAWQADDVALLFIATDGGVPTLSTPNGFVLATDVHGNTASATTNGGVSGANDCAITIFVKRLIGSTTATDPAPVVAAASTWGGTIQTLHINTYRGCRNTGNPIHLLATAVVTTATTTIAPPAVTPTLNGCTLITCVASANDDSAFNAWTFAGSANPTGQLDNGWHGSTGNGASFCGGRAGYATAGGSRSGTSSFGASTKQAQITLVLASLPEVGSPDDAVSMVGGLSAPAPLLIATPAQEEIPIAAATIRDDVDSFVGWMASPTSGIVFQFCDELPIALSASIVDDDQANASLGWSSSAWASNEAHDTLPSGVASVVDDDQRSSSLEAPLTWIAVGDLPDTLPSTGPIATQDDEPATMLALVAPSTVAIAAFGESDEPNGSIPPITMDDTPWLDVALRFNLAQLPLTAPVDELPIAAVSAAVGGASDVQRSFEAPPQSGTLTTVAPIPSWAQSTAYVVDPTAGGINRVKNGGILYQCASGGTSSSSGTGPNATTLGSTQTDGGVTWYVVGPVSGTDTIAGSQIIATVMRGNQSQTPGGAIDPTDNDGGTFSVITNNAYASFTASFAGVWRRTTASNAKTNYTISAQFGGSSGAGDELSAAWIELRGVVVGAPHAFSHVERASPSGGTVTAAPITTTKRCLILSFWYGNGTVVAAGSPDAATPAGGLTLIANATAPLSLTVNGYIQHMVAFRFANPGTFAEVWTSSPTNEGAQLVTVAFEDPSGTGSALDAEPYAPVVMFAQPPIFATTAANDEIVTLEFDADQAPILFTAPATDSTTSASQEELPTHSALDDESNGSATLTVAATVAASVSDTDLVALVSASDDANSTAELQLVSATSSASIAQDIELAAQAAPDETSTAQVMSLPVPTLLSALADAESPTAIPAPGDDEPTFAWQLARVTDQPVAQAPIDEFPAQVLDDVAWTFAVNWSVSIGQATGSIDDEVPTPPPPPPAGLPDDEVSWSSGTWSVTDTVWSPSWDELGRFTAAPLPLPIRVRVISTAATVIILPAPGDLVPEPFRQGATHRPLEANAFNAARRINFPEEFPGGVAFLMVQGSTRITGPAIGDEVGNLTYAWGTHDLDVPGTYAGYFTAVDGSGATQTFPDGTNLQIVVTPTL